MAVLALAAAGAAVGAWAIPGTILGMSGAGFGWMVGSMAGSLLFPPKVPDGPRLEDRAVQVSTYGQPIPRIHGTHRTSGNVIWATDLNETEHEQGKGGPSYTTYTYSCSFAVGICQGPIDGILRIWADGNLIHDSSAANTGPQNDFNASGMVVYGGTEDQLPDPTIEAAIGDAPAYRGLAYVVFSDLQLEKYGNRIPSLSFEVVQHGTFTPRPPVETSPGYSHSVIDPDTGYIWSISENVPSTNKSTIYVYDPKDDVLVQTLEINIPSDHLAFDETDRVFRACATWAASAGVDYAGLSAYPVALLGYGDPLSAVSAHPGIQVLYRARWLIGSTAGVTSHTVYAPPYYDENLTPVVVLGTDGSWTMQMLNVHEYDVAVRLGWASRIQFMQSGPYGIQVIANFIASWDSGGDQSFSHDTQRDLLFWTKPGETTTAYLINIEARSMQLITFPSPIVGGIDHAVYHPGIDRYVAMSGTQTLLIHPETFAVERSIEQGVGSYLLLADPLLVDRVYGIALSPSSSGHVFFLTEILTPDLVPLSDVVAAESDLVGLESADIDVTALADVLVHGFAVGGGTVRSAIEQLMMAYQFDAVESGGVVKFVRRGGAVVATLDDTDLAAHQPGNEVPTPLPITRAEEVELPQRITVRYSNPDADYQTGAQSAQRLTGRAVAQAGVDLPIVLTDAQAAQVAEAALYSAWVARMSTSFTTTHKHAALEPTDVVVAGGNTLRITKRTENAGLITFDAAFESGNVFTQVNQGAASSMPQQTIRTYGRTALEFLDVPPLRDQDHDAGFYVAAAGYRSGWDGALLYKSLDAGQSYEELLLLPNAATTGTALDALVDRSENTFDSTSHVTVSLLAGQLYSASQIAVLGGANAALLGDELIQFKTATLNGGGSYTLRDLLRGRKGTPTAGHAAGDRFILLNAASLRRTPAVVSEIGLERLYKPVTLGSTQEATRALGFTNTANALRPMSPVHIRAGRESGHIYINWTRRSLVLGEWRDSVDVDGGVVGSALFRINIYSSASHTTVVRTWTTSVGIALNNVYLLSDQITDFGSAQSVVYVGVCEISSVVGAGHMGYGIV